LPVNAAVGDEEDVVPEGGEVPAAVAQLRLDVEVGRHLERRVAAVRGHQDPFAGPALQPDQAPRAAFRRRPAHVAQRNAARHHGGGDRAGPQSVRLDGTRHGRCPSVACVVIVLPDFAFRKKDPPAPGTARFPASGVQVLGRGAPKTLPERTGPPSAPWSIRSSSSATSWSTSPSNRTVPFASPPTPTAASAWAWAALAPTSRCTWHAWEFRFGSSAAWATTAWRSSCAPP